MSFLPIEVQGVQFMDRIPLFATYVRKNGLRNMIDGFVIDLIIYEKLKSNVVCRI